MTTLLSMLDRFEQAAVTYETSTDKADRDELHAARRAIMEAFSARATSGSELLNLVAEWRRRVKAIGRDVGSYRQCADELEVALSAVPQPATPSMEMVWVQNLRAFIKGEFPITDKWREVFLREFDKVALSTHPAPAIMEREAELVKALTELHAIVWGECPALLNEDSGGDARLDLAIRALIDPSLEQE